MKKNIFQKQIIGLLVLFNVCVACLSCNSDRSLYRVQVDGLYGFIDSTGAIIIEPSYVYVSPFSKDGYATVISNFSIIGDSSVKITYGYINSKNELVVDTTNQIETPVNNYAAQWGGDAIDQQKKFESHNFSFNDLILPYLHLKEGLYVYQDASTKKFGYKDIEGNVAIEAQYDMAHPYSCGHAVVLKILPKEEMDTIRAKESEMELSMKLLNRWFLINKQGEKKSQYYGVINDFNSSGKTWAAVVAFNSTNLETQWEMVDTAGAILLGPLAPIVTRVYNSTEPPYICKVIFDNFFSFIDKDGELISDFDKSGTLSWGNEAFINAIRFSEGFGGLPVRDQLKEIPAWCFVNRKLEIVSESYDSIKPFSEGLAPVKELLSGDFSISKWGYVKHEGGTIKQAIPYNFSDCGLFHLGLAYFRKDGNIYDIEGYINKKGTIVWQTKRRNFD